MVIHSGLHTWPLFPYSGAPGCKSYAVRPASNGRQAPVPGFDRQIRVIPVRKPNPPRFTQDGHLVASGQAATRSRVPSPPNTIIISTVREIVLQGHTSQYELLIEAVELSINSFIPVYSTTRLEEGETPVLFASGVW